MAQIAIVTPARAGARNGNRHTAQRWAGFLRAQGHRVTVRVEWDGRPCDLLLALHARRSHASVLRFRKLFPDRPIVVALTGTDLYRDLPHSAEARRSLELAERVIVLQPQALESLPGKIRRKARVVFQSTSTTLRQLPPGNRFRVAVVGHLREEKDPFRAALALSHLEQDLEVVQIGNALSPAFSSTARKLMRKEPRYRWLGGRTHPQTLAWIARSHLLVVSSVMEGGANVISEATRIGTPILASRVPGNVGMLGSRHPGFFPLFDEEALASLIGRSIESSAFYGKLRRATAARRPLFSPAAEARALRGALRGLPGRRA